MSESPSHLPAIACPATRAALRKGAVWPWVTLVLGIINVPALAAAFALGNSTDSDAIRTGAGVVGVVALPLIFAGTLSAIMVWRRRRKVRSVQRYPWVPYPVHYFRSPANEYVQLLDADGTVVSTLLFSTWGWQVGTVVNASTREVWFAGDPHRHGVLSRPGGGQLCYASHSRPPTAAEFTGHDREPGSLPAGHAADTTVHCTMHHDEDRTAMRSSAEQAHPPKRHGASNDPDYPSPRTLRRTLAFLLDMAIHIACGIGAGAAVSPAFSPEALRHNDWQHLGVNPAAVVGFWLAASFADRVIIQAITHTTIGKAVFGLVVLRPDTGQIPSPGRLLAAWLLDIWMPIAILADIAGNGGSLGPEKTGDYILPAVRRRDLRQHNSIEQP